MLKAYFIRNIDSDLYIKAKAQAALANETIGKWINKAIALKLNLYEDFFDENCEWQGRLIKCPDAWFLIVLNEEDIELLVEKVKKQIGKKATNLFVCTEKAVLNYNFSPKD